VDGQVISVDVALQMPQGLGKYWYIYRHMEQEEECMVSQVWDLISVGLCKHSVWAFGQVSIHLDHRR